MVASIQDPAAECEGQHLRLGAGVALKATNASPGISAALVTSRPVRATPSTTATSVDRIRSHASGIRLMINTW